MQIVVLAGGLGTRLRPITQENPKSIILVNNKTFLEYQIELFKRHGLFDIVLCVGYGADKIMNYFGDGNRFGVNISYSMENDELLGTAGALKKAEPMLEDVFFVTYGDSYLILDYGDVMAYFKEFDKLGLMVVYKNFNSYAKSDVVIEGDSVRYVKVYDKKTQTADMVYINFGVSVLRKRALSLVPPERPIDLQGFYKVLIEQRELLAYETHNRFYEIGSFRGLEQFKQLINSEAAFMDKKPHERKIDARVL